MVRILSYHHFRGQRTGQCEEPVAVAVAGNEILVALDHQINVYGHSNQPISSTSPRKFGQNVSSVPDYKRHENFPIHEIGLPFTFYKDERLPMFESVKRINPATSANESPVGSPEVDGDIKLSHSFATIELITHMEYNNKGCFILCLEKRDNQSSGSENLSVRTYFHWEKNHELKPVRARIAGLVSPTGSESEDDSLMMVEIPLTSSAAAVSSCQLTGNLVVLVESIVHVYTFKVKEVVGRVKLHYYDFDKNCSFDLQGFAPQKLSFLTNYVGCFSENKIRVFAVRKPDTLSTKTTCSADCLREPMNSLQNNRNSSKSKFVEKVVFDPKNESCKVYLNYVTKANSRKRRIPNPLIVEEFGDEITSDLTELIFQEGGSSGIVAEDLVRISISPKVLPNSQSRLVNLQMYPVRIKDELGGVSMCVSTPNEVFLYHLPRTSDKSVVRVTSYQFTASLIGIKFDGVFFHAITETGSLETYTTRCLYNAIEDTEGIKLFHNDCPFRHQPAALVGIRPFVNVRDISCNGNMLCLLACPSNSNGAKQVPQTQPGVDDSRWTIYALELPDIETIYDEMIRSNHMQTLMQTDTENYFALVAEAHYMLRLYMNAHPELIPGFEKRYKETCKLIGLFYLKDSIIEASLAASTSTDVLNNTDANSTSNNAKKPSKTLRIREDVADQGVTYLLMGRHGVQEIFSPENWTLVKDPNYIPGFVRLIEVTFIESAISEHQKLSPTLTPLVVDFLSNNKPEALVRLVIRNSFIRECNSKRLLTVLEQLTEASNHGLRETLALLLTIVTVGGVETSTRVRFKEIIKNVPSKSLVDLLTKDVILESRGHQMFLTDFSICLVDSGNHSFLSKKIVHWIHQGKVSTSAILFACAQALNANSDSGVQLSVTRFLTSTFENYFSEKLMDSQELSSESFQEDEIRAVQLLVRTYLTNIHSSLTQTRQPQTTAVTESSESEQSQPKPGDGIAEINYQIFGPVYTCVNFLLSVSTAGGTLTPQSQNLAVTTLIPNEDCRENFIKLLSLLCNPYLGNVNSVREIIITFVSKSATQVKSTTYVTLYFILQVLSETPDKAVNILLLRQPTTVLLFAKETFGHNPGKWKILVTQLKQSIKTPGSKQTDVDVYTTILEGVYLHLANTLSPDELEQVLDKETEERNKFHAMCKRVELANTYANMVITVSTDFLNRK